MRVEQLTRIFKQRHVVDDVDIPRGVQARLLAKVAGLYESLGLIADDQAPALFDCLNAKDCWRPVLNCRPAHVNERAGITLPWIGPQYVPGGVAVLAINLRDAGGLLEEYTITCQTAGTGSQLNELAAGRGKAHGSRVAYASVRPSGSNGTGTHDKPPGRSSGWSRGTSLPGDIARSGRLETPMDAGRLPWARTFSTDAFPATSDLRRSTLTGAPRIAPGCIAGR